MIRFLPLLFAAMTTLLCSTLSGQIPLPLHTLVTENFSTIGNSPTATLPAGWRMSPSGNAVGAWADGVATTSQAASSGTPATGGRYNWATTAGEDRAIGFWTDGSYNSDNAIMAHYRNTTGAPLSSVTVAFAVERYWVNSGSFSLSFASSTDETTWTAQNAGDIAAGLFAPGAAAGTFDAPQTITRTVTVNVAVPDNGDLYFRWIFHTGNTNAQGLGLDNVTVFAGTPTPVITAKLKDLLQVDNGTQNQFNEGDVIRYQTVIKNIGTGDASNLAISIPAPSNTTLLPGSVKTSAVAADDNYTTTSNTTLNGSSVLANDFGVPAPTTVLTFGPSANAAATNAGNAGTSDAGGSVTVQPDGTFSYTPAVGFSGTDRFAYITGNGNGPNNDAVVLISVLAEIAFSTTETTPSCNGATNGGITFSASGGVPPLTYSITGAGGTFQASPVFTGLAGGTYSLVVKDATGNTKTASVTLSEPAVLALSGTISDGEYNTALTPATFTTSGGTGAVNWSATGLPAGVSINNTTGVVSGTPSQTGTFNAVITATDANGCTATQNAAFKVTPKLNDDTYTATGNTQLVANGHSVPTTPYTASTVNILGNDGADAALTVTAVTNAATTNGGTITMDAAGKFIYTPPAGATAADSYTYTATANGVSATATLNFNISNMVWYVNNTYSGSNGVANGTSHRPFATVNGAASAAVANQVIYVHTGSGSTSGDAVLKAGQTLRGAGAALTVGDLSIAAGTKPTLAGTITLANNVTVDGFDMATGTNTALTNNGSTVTGANVNLGHVTTSTGTGLALTGTGNNVTMTLASLTTNGAVNAINVANTAGTITINGGSLTGGVGTVVNINGGAASLAYSGSISQANAYHAVSITNKNGGTVNLSGNVNGTNASKGITLSSNPGATINFTGGVTLNGTASVFAATGGGTVTVTGSANTIGNTTAPTTTALAITNTTIGASGVTFQKVSNSGGVNGINLSNTGSGSFTVTGDGASDPANTTRGRTTAKLGGGTIALGSGGTISSTSGAGILASGTGPITIRNMVILNGSKDGFIATNVSGCTIDNTLITGMANGYGFHPTSVSNISIQHSEIRNNATAAATAGPDINNIRYDEVTGTCTMQNSLFGNSLEHGVHVINNSGALNLAVTNCTLSGSQSGMGVYPAGTANVSINVQGSTISDNSARGFQTGTGTGSNATLSTAINNCQFTNNFVGVDIAHGSSGTHNFNVSNTNFQNHGSVSININRLGSTSFMSFGLFTGTVSNNTIGIVGIPNSGSVLGTNTIDIKTNGSGGSIQISVLNNTIREIGNDGIRVIGRDAPSATGGHTLNVKIQGNNIANFHPSALSGIRAELGAASGDLIRMCLDINSNVVTNAPQNGIRVRSVGGGTPPPVCILTMPGWNGTGATYLASQNPAATGIMASTSFANSNSGSSTNTGICTTP